MQKLDSNIDDFVTEHCVFTAKLAEGSTPAQLMQRMKYVDDELKAVKDLEGRLRQKWHFVSPQNRHRVKLNRLTSEYMKLRN